MWRRSVSGRKPGRNSNLIYRAYRVPYDWVPQLEKPDEAPVENRDVSEFSLSGRSPKAVNRVIDMADAEPLEVEMKRLSFYPFGACERP